MWNPDGSPGGYTHRTENAATTAFFKIADQFADLAKAVGLAMLELNDKVKEVSSEIPLTVAPKHVVAHEIISICSTFAQQVGGIPDDLVRLCLVVTLPLTTDRTVHPHVIENPDLRGTFSSTLQDWKDSGVRQPWTLLLLSLYDSDLSPVFRT
jgi:hypothetical protein